VPSGHRTLVVFVRHPRPGAVKTRLAAGLGPDVAAALYRVLVEGVLEATAPRAREYERLLFYDPPDAGEAVRAWLPAGRLRRQAAGDLGVRMADAFVRAFARGARRVAIVGSDVSGLVRGDVEAAFAALDEADLVLGPAYDGGYYLIALSQARPELFRDLQWSTSSVRQRTLERAAASGLRVAQLRPLRDVDTLDDLRAEWPALQPLLARDPGLREQLARALRAGETPVGSGTESSEGGLR
jgi:rSAM/selenodomain-associated transferase 1